MANQERTIQIRQATVDNAATLARLNVAVHVIHTEARPEIFKAPVVDEFIVHMRDRLNQPDWRALIAEVDGLPVGYATTLISKRPENPFAHPGEHIVVDNISVEPDYRSQGVGEALMEQVYVLAREEGIQRVTLTVWAFNERAIAFYERLGFKPFQVHMEKILD
jgi:diamine N-acetyltransferase